jgi:hypothetical protein
MGRELRPEPLAVATGLPVAQVLARLERFTRHGLLAPTGEGHFDFTHDLVPTGFTGPCRSRAGAPSTGRSRRRCTPRARPTPGCTARSCDTPLWRATHRARRAPAWPPASTACGTALERATTMAAAAEIHWREYECMVWSATIDWERQRYPDVLVQAGRIVEVVQRMGETQAPFAQALAALARLRQGDCEAAAALSAALQKSSSSEASTSPRPTR